MAGRGPVPKAPGRRARRNSGSSPLTTLRFEAAPQPTLPGEGCHPATVEWWKTWGECPQAEQLMAVDWSFLVDTAVFHDAVWRPRDTGRSAAGASKGAAVADVQV